MLSDTSRRTIIQLLGEVEATLKGERGLRAEIDWKHPPDHEKGAPQQPIASLLEELETLTSDASDDELEEVFDHFLASTEGEAELGPLSDDLDLDDESELPLLRASYRDGELEPFEGKLQKGSEAKALEDARYRNWLGQQETETQLHAWKRQLADFEELKSVVTSGNQKLRVNGKRHADNRVAQPEKNSLLIDLGSFGTAGKLADVRFEHFEADGKHYVRLFAWETLEEVASRLRRGDGRSGKSFALINTGSFTRQSLAGPLSVGTHGSGASLGAMCDQVLAVDILKGNGEVVRVKAEGFEPPDEAQASAGRAEAKHIRVQLPHNLGRYETTLVQTEGFTEAVVSLGMLGIVLSYWVEVVPDYRLYQDCETMPTNQAITRIKQTQDRLPRHVELLVVPHELGEESRCVLIERRLAGASDSSKNMARYPLRIRRMARNWRVAARSAGMMNCCKWVRRMAVRNTLKYQMKNKGQCGNWDQVLVRNTGVPAYGFEVCLPLDQADRALVAVQKAIDKGKNSHGFARVQPTSPYGVRFASASSQSLAMTYRCLPRWQKDGSKKLSQVDTFCFIEVPRIFGTINQKSLVRAILSELQAARIDFRQHWGQYTEAQERDAAADYPKLEKFLELREQFDPQRRFLTSYLAQVLGINGDT